MILMEGLMLVPPERGTIIGRALWKPRYVVLGTGARMQTQNDLFLAQSESAGRVAPVLKGLKTSSSKLNLSEATPAEVEGYFISIFKAKGDWEFLAQHPVSAFQSCEIRPLQYRKQGPSPPTLLLELKPDPNLEKQRKRRSSRTGALTPKDPWGNTLLFRSVPDERHNIYHWQMMVKLHLHPDTPDEPAPSPLSPPFNPFSNPFTPRDSRLPSSHRPDVQHRPMTQTISTYPHAPRERERPTALISPSPSLRSRRSDVSSQSSSLHPPMGFTSSHPHIGGVPADLPSPASTVGYDTQFIEGWTSAQGRSSALSSHTRGSNSIASAAAPQAQLTSTPPGPRETILDRAFQMRYIPGMERSQDKDEERTSSIARFEALMKEADERKQQKQQKQQKPAMAAQVAAFRSEQDCQLSGESDESEQGELYEEYDDADADELEMSDQDIVIPTPAQRALDYISGRQTPLPRASHSRPISPNPQTPPLPFLNHQAMSALQGNPSDKGLRPRASTHIERPNSLAAPSRSISSAAIPSLKDTNGGSTNSTYGATLTPGAEGVEKRRSSTSVKRLSFNEFAKRLSSTSSLLLVQTNASSSSGGRDGSRRGSSEYGVEAEDLGRFSGGLRNNVNMRGSAVVGMNDRERESWDQRCGWRGSVGIFGGEGGFL